MLINKWELKNIGEEVKNFTDLWDGANKTKHTDQVIKAINPIKRGNRIKQNSYFLGFR